MQSLYGKPRGANVRGEQVPISLSHLIWIHIVVFNYLTRCTSIMVEQQTRNQSKTSVAAAFSDFVHYSWIWTRIEKSLEKMNIVHCTQLNEGINLFCAFISECHPLKNWFAPIWSLKRMLINQWSWYPRITNICLGWNIFTCCLLGKYCQLAMQLTSRHVTEMHRGPSQVILVIWFYLELIDPLWNFGDV